MANYRDAACQTLWAGLTRSSLVRPDILFSAPATSTPPEELLVEKPQAQSQLQLATMLTSESQARRDTTSAAVDRRGGRPKLIARISLPRPEFNEEEGLPSPPPTHALLSPLPAANRLHAGHTPKQLRALSPGHDEISVQPDLPIPEPPSYLSTSQKPQPRSPDQDVGLTGPLSLPALPTVLKDGDDEHIALDALDQELSKIAREQERFSKLRDAPEPTRVEPAEPSLPPGRKGSATTHYRSDDPDAPDGVILKSPTLNFGSPFGQMPQRRNDSDVPPL